VEAGGPADKGGLRSGDVILSYGGNPIKEANELPRLVAATQPGSEAKLEIWREGERRTLAVTVGEFQDEQPPRAATPGQPQQHDRLGLVLSEVAPTQRRQLGIDYGLRVERVVGGAAANSPVRPGDVIVAINQSRFSSRDEFERLIAQAPEGGTVALLVRRGEALVYVPLKLAVS